MTPSELYYQQRRPRVMRLIMILMFLCMIVLAIIGGWR